MADDDFEDEPTLDEEDMDEDVLEEDFVEDDEVLDDDLVEEIDPEIIDVVAVPGVLVVPPRPRPRTKRTTSSISTRNSPRRCRRGARRGVARAHRRAGPGRGRGRGRRARRAWRDQHQDRAAPREECWCKSCFLVLPRHQLADEKRMICHDSREATTTRDGRAQIAAAAASARCSQLSRPPIDLGPLACVALVPLLVAWRGRLLARRGGTRVRRGRRVLRVALVECVLRRGRDRAVRGRVRAVLAAAGALDRDGFAAPRCEPVPRRRGVGLRRGRSSRWPFGGFLVG